MINMQINLRKVIITKKKQNKLQHIINRNRNNIHDKKTCYRLMTVNKGNAKFTTKQEELKHILNDNNPDVVAITEANMPENHDDIKKELSNYNIEN